MLPTLRKNIRSDVSKNKALRDILSPTAKALEIISVEELEYQVYNTKTIAIIEENGIIEERVLIYNRLALNELLSEATISGSTIEQIINNLNEQGFDFTTDDLELVSGQVKAKATSLGYYNKTAVSNGGDHVYATMDSVGQVLVNGQPINIDSPTSGVAVYDTADGIGCWSLGRYQNMTNQVLNVELILEGGDFHGFGLLYLSPQDNTTVVGFDGTGLNEGYRRLSFTLQPNSTNLPMRPDKVAFQINSFGSLPRKNSSNQDYSYRFVVDDVVVQNPLGGDTFLITQDILVSNLTTALLAVGVRTDNYYYNNAPNILHLSFGAEIGTWKKIRVSQLGSIDASTRMILMLPEEPFLITNSSVEKTIEAFAYDPWNPEV